MQEECRHILLFENWAAWPRAKLSWWRRIRFELKVAAVWAFLGWERMRLAQAFDAEGKEHKQDNNFTVNGAQSLPSVKMSLRELMTLCLAENERRFSGYDGRLLRPETIPKIVGFALRFMSLTRDRLTLPKPKALRALSIIGARNMHRIWKRHGTGRFDRE